MKLNLTKPQLKVFKAQQRFKVLVSGRRFGKTLINVVKGFAETKTENKLRTFLSRKKKSNTDYTPYDSEKVISVLLKNNPIYSYSESAYKTVRTLTVDFVKYFNSK